jgi:arylformamidase
LTIASRSAISREFELMTITPIIDWDDAYANTAHIPGGSDYPGKWRMQAAAFRDEMLQASRLRPDIGYGPNERNRYDMFLPVGPSRGLVAFVHGGFWMEFDKSFWSHLARGPLERGFAVVMPSYELCPHARISEITQQISRMIAAAASEGCGPIHLVGHSAGGHLVTLMVASPSPLALALRMRIRKVVSISGLHDLRPLLKTAMNVTLCLDASEAFAQSPALHEPLPDIDLTCWVGAAERPEFIRQSALLASIWTGLGARVGLVEEPEKHHFNVIEGLCAPDHPMTRTLLAL